MRMIGITAALLAASALSGCAMFGGDKPAPAQQGTYPATALGVAQQGAADTAAPSEVIGGLMARRSLLGAGPLAQVADAVIDANSRAAEAELRAAVLRSAAKSRNWLPRIGPSLNLTSLGGFVAGLVIDQALYDHGARAAERAYARADVEVAATALAEDSNARVHEALGLYLTAQKALAQAAALSAADADIARYIWIVEERVNAGITDRAELQVVRQRRDQINADIAADRETAAVAMAELNAMAALLVDHLRGLSSIGSPPAGSESLPVIKARAEGERAMAEAAVLRAGYLPGLSLGGDIAGDGLGLTVAAPNGIGFGQAEAIAAAEAEGQAVALRVTREQEATDRAVAQLEGRLTSLTRQAAENRSIADQARENYRLYAEQQRAGQRDVTDVVAVLDTRLRADRAAVGYDYDIVAARLAIAARLGLLVNGDRM